VKILDRASGEILSSFGRPGHQVGEFTHAHTLAVDSKGNVYVAETDWGRRVQKFRPVSRDCPAATSLDLSRHAASDGSLNVGKRARLALPTGQFPGRTRLPCKAAPARATAIARGCR
jgi:hypothetical protein